MTDQESVEAKKERMRQYMAADRKLEAERDKRHRRPRGCLFSLLKMTAIVAAIAGVAYLIWLWHPWGTAHDEYDALEHEGICSPGVSGTRTVDHLTVFGTRVMQTGESVMCVE